MYKPLIVILALLTICFDVSADLVKLSSTRVGNSIGKSELKGYDGFHVSISHRYASKGVEYLGSK